MIVCLYLLTYINVIVRKGISWNITQVLASPVVIGLSITNLNKYAVLVLLTLLYLPILYISIFKLLSNNIIIHVSALIGKDEESIRFKFQRIYQNFSSSNLADYNFTRHQSYRSCKTYIPPSPWAHSTYPSRSKYENMKILNK